MAESSQIADNLASIKEQISQAAARCDRDPSLIQLIAVSKRKPTSCIQDAIQANHFVFGENYVQEAREKIEQLSAMPGFDGQSLRFDLIGPLQRNKAKVAVELFDLIQTVDRDSLARAISKEAQKREMVQPVLMQVNVSGEKSKSGCPIEDATVLAQLIESLPAIELRGLMAIGSYVPEDADDAERRREFIAMGKLKHELEKTLGRELPELSIGMSHDFDLAIEQGATMVRVGTAIFGQRS